MYHRDSRSYINQNYVWPITKNLLNVRRIVLQDSIFDIMNHCHKRQRVSNVQQLTQEEIEAINQQIDKVEIVSNFNFFSFFLTLSL